MIPRLAILLALLASTAAAGFVEKKVWADRDKVAIDWSPSAQAIEAGKTMAKPAWALKAFNGRFTATLSLRGSDGQPHARSEVKEVAAKGGKKNLAKAHKGREFKLANPGTLTLTPVDEIVYPNGETFAPENGCLKWELTLDAAPPRGPPSTATNACWVLDLALTAGSTAAYQPPLTQAEVDIKASRPEWCVGSYVIFAPNDGPKMFHLPRPCAKDAKGAWTWGAVQIAADLKSVSISIPWAWLEDPARKYPVVVDPTFGYTTIGGSSGNIDAAVYLFTNPPASPASNGTLDSISIYGSIAGSGFVSINGLWSQTAGVPDALLDTCSSVAIPYGAEAWYTGTSTTHPAMSAGTNYYYGASQSGNAACRYDTVGSRPYRLYSYTGTLPNPWGTVAGNVGNTISAYVTYTEAASGLIRNPSMIGLPHTANLTGGTR